jgi:hypothetical protein
MGDLDRSRAGAGQRADGTVRRPLLERGPVCRGWRCGGDSRTAGRECTAPLRDSVAYGVYFRVGTSPWAEQQQRRQAAVQRPTEEAGPRQQSDKKSGRQQDHPGETLRRTETPDAIIEHYLSTCTACGAVSTSAMARDQATRQMFHLPKPQPLIVIVHRAHGCRCAACAQRRERRFPQASPRRFSTASGPMP